MVVSACAAEPGPGVDGSADLDQDIAPAGDLLTVFNNNVYLGGGLTLHALRQQIGDPAFRAVERAWVTTFRGRSASTEDFIGLASRVSGQDLTAFLRDWLFGTTTPAMPGHPDWTVNPLPPAMFASSTAAAAALALPPELDLRRTRRY